MTTLRIAALALTLPLCTISSIASANCGGGTFAGSYVGVHVGYAEAKGKFTSPDDPKISDTDNAFTFGGISGYNIQCDNIVIGIEGDLNYVGFETRGTWSDPVGNPVNLRDKIDFYSTTRGRLGIVVHPDTMLYATAGFADAHVSDKLTHDAAGFEQTDKKWKFGYVVGGGIELMSSNALSFRAEAMFVDLGSKEHTYTLAGCGVACTDTAKWDDSFWTIRLGATYKFDLAPPADHTPLK